ncbi:Arc family DNA-binding protein [Nocardiopsis dassonvillei]|uniref:CopG domain protein DNA-binding domain protein n=1 Tax=Nocardiopsis dassonvillei (strain ATCC 23218 / DSM 43111 / CIP 107115 / JCM 7437 / KCTC 9190 / NBRC 14626 / NCTC 10488 / NRRL B-5397 / IMRU 509) TaxID=446468 RepID=D7B6M8_NOCDD|nr:Arc family DNA-binding protein [Nocardiopsis dassonvillei]ADH69315.1 CopG domain protein DNA-binding domain protein [Nocardiopsis dassonvillei subsp. dassonvillei DSM 43111]NKY81064.1 Arc family DNA-binding protein [Nocardiopsis dassonvillei]VEI89825.1 Arc-like DNA binding domain [Nocardiopsis dassonvillei]
MNMHLRLPDDVHTGIREVAEEDGNSVNTEVVIALKEFLANRQTERVRQYALEIAEEDAELLARLAE